MYIFIFCTLVLAFIIKHYTYSTVGGLYNHNKHNKYFQLHVYLESLFIVLNTRQAQKSSAYKAKMHWHNKPVIYLCVTDPLLQVKILLHCFHKFLVVHRFSEGYWRDVLLDLNMAVQGHNSRRGKKFSAQTFQILQFKI